MTINNRLRQLLALPGLFFPRQAFDPFLDGMALACNTYDPIGLAERDPFCCDSAARIATANLRPG